MSLKVKKKPSYYFGVGIGYSKVKEALEVSFKGNSFLPDHLIEGKTYYFPYEKIRERNIYLKGNNSNLIIDGNLFHKNVGEIDNFDGDVEIIYNDTYRDFEFSEIVNCKKLSLTKLKVFAKAGLINLDNEHKYLHINRCDFSCDYIGNDSHKRIALHISNSDNIKFIGCDFSNIDFQIFGSGLTKGANVNFVNCVFNKVSFNFEDIDNLKFINCVLSNTKQPDTKINAKNITFNKTMVLLKKSHLIINCSEKCTFFDSNFEIEESSFDVYSRILKKNVSSFYFYSRGFNNKFTVVIREGIVVDGKTINTISKAKKSLIQNYNISDKDVVIEYDESLANYVNHDGKIVTDFLTVVERYNPQPILDLEGDVISFSVLQDIINKDVKVLRKGSIFSELNSALIRHFEKNNRGINPFRRVNAKIDAFEKEFFNTPHFSYNLELENKEPVLAISKIWLSNKPVFNNIILTVKKEGSSYDVECNQIKNIGGLGQEIENGFDSVFDIYNYYKNRYNNNLAIRKTNSRSVDSIYSSTIDNNSYVSEEILCKDEFDGFLVKATLNRDFKFSFDIDKTNLDIELDDCKGVVGTTVFANESYLNMLKVRISDLPLVLRNIVVDSVTNSDSFEDKVNDSLVTDYINEIADEQGKLAAKYVTVDIKDDNLYSTINDANEQLENNPNLLKDIFGLEVVDGKLDFTLMRENYKKEIEVSELNLKITDEVLTLLGCDPFLRADALLNKTQALLKLDKIDESTGFVVDEIKHGAYDVSIYIDESGKFASNIKINDSIRNIDEIENARLVKMKNDFPNIILSNIPSDNDNGKNYLLSKKK